MPRAKSTSGTQRRKRSNGARQPHTRREIELPRRTHPPSLPRREPFWYGAADTAKSIAEEFAQASATLRDSRTTADEKTALANLVWDAHWAMLGHRAKDVPAIAIAFVTAIELAIRHVEDWRRIAADPTREHLESHRPLMSSVTAEETARAIFERRYHKEAALLTADDMALAVRAVQGDTGDKAGTLTTIIRERLRLKITSNSLASYLKRHRRRGRPPWGGH